MSPKNELLKIARGYERNHASCVRVVEINPTVHRIILGDFSFLVCDQGIEFECPPRASLVWSVLIESAQRPDLSVLMRASTCPLEVHAAANTYAMDDWRSLQAPSLFFSMTWDAIMKYSHKKV